MEEIKEYIKQRIEWLRKHTGKETAGEKELQKIIEKFYSEQ